MQKGIKHKIFPHSSTGKQAWGSQKKRRTFWITETAFQTGSFDLRRMGLCSVGTWRSSTFIPGNFGLLRTQEHSYYY